jgi:hypothetical protein
LHWRDIALAWRRIAWPLMKRKQSCHTEGFRPDRFRTLLSLAVAVLFAFQGILVNSHVHLPMAPTGLAIAQSVQVNHHKTQTPDADSTCALCLAAALIGSYAQPPMIILLVPVEFLLLERTHFDHLRIIPAHHRAWQSRAPPIA